MAALAVVALGLAVRLLAARGDLWLDEIWSLEAAGLAPSAAAIFTSMHHDNNHYLNTLYLYLLGPDAPDLTYRLLSVVTGGAAIAVAASTAAHRGRVERLTWAALLAVCPILVHYSSEARGYAPAVLAAVVCFAAMERLLDGWSRADALVFAAGASLGLTAHLTFVQALAAFLAWALARALQDGPLRSRAGMLAAAFGPPLAILALLWLVDLRHLMVGGGPPYDVLEVLRHLLRASLGAPRGALEILAWVPVAGAACAVGALVRRRSAEGVFFLVLLVIAPAGLLLAARPAYLAPRYFLVGVPFLLLLVARVLAYLAQRGRWGGMASAAVMALFLAGSGTQIARLLADGRGHYREAIAWIVQHAPGPITTVGSDHDWRNQMVLQYHERRMGLGRSLRYVPDGQWSARQPVWFLHHDFADEPQPPPAILGPAGRRYDLVRHFPYAGLSGWHWFLYRMADGP